MAKCPVAVVFCVLVVAQILHMSEAKRGAKPNAYDSRCPAIQEGMIGICVEECGPNVSTETGNTN